MYPGRVDSSRESWWDVCVSHPSYSDGLNWVRLSNPLIIRQRSGVDYQVL